MDLNRLIKVAVGAALVSAASVPALATTITPPSSGPVPLPGLTNGGVIVEVYDPTTGTALTEWLGPDVGTFGAPSSMPAGGETLDYGVLGGSEFATLFPAAQIAAGNVIFTVSAVNDVNPNAPIVDMTLSQVGTITLSALKGVAASGNTGVGSILNGPSACNNANPCFVTSGGTSNANWAAQYFGANLGGLASGNNAGAAVGGSLDFYQVTGTGSSLTKQTPVQFTNPSTSAAAVWTLSATGDLTYTVPGSGPPPVPLPAAVWLFGSGLLGLAGIGRRKLVAA
jgi:hypothetical protein